MKCFIRGVKFLITP